MPRAAVRAAGGHHPRPHRGGHRQAHPRRRRRAHPRRRAQPRRLQPLRRAARGDRVRGRHAHAATRPRSTSNELRAILLATGVSDAKMEEGSMRVDANVSVNRAGEPWGTRCEIKNLNSLRSLGRAIDHEALRQIDLLEGGETVRQETRHWDEAAGRTGTLRVKEDADDYRYFPEPDLVPLEPDRRGHRSHRRRPPGAARRSPHGAGRGRRASRPPAARSPSPSTAASTGWRSPPSRAGADAGPGAHPRRAQPGRRGRRVLSAEHLAALVTMETGGELTATQAKTVLAEVVATGSAPGRRSPRRTASRRWTPARSRASSTT